MANEVTFKINISGKDVFKRFVSDTEKLIRNMSSWTCGLSTTEDLLSNIESTSWSFFGCLNSLSNQIGFDKLSKEFSSLFSNFLSSLKDLKKSLSDTFILPSQTIHYVDSFRTDLRVLTSESVLPRLFSYYNDWLKGSGLSDYSGTSGTLSYSSLVRDITLLSFAVRNLNDTILTADNLRSNENLADAYMRENEGKLPATLTDEKLGSLLSELSKLQEHRNFLGAIMGVEDERTNIQTGISQTRRYLSRMFGDESPDLLKSLQTSLKSFKSDLVNAPTIDGKLEASAKISEIQREIDEQTHGKISISAPLSPVYSAPGTIDDKRRSYKNSVARLNVIKEDYEMGLIGFAEARKEVKSLNKDLASLGLSRFSITLDSRGFKKSMDSIKNGWGSIQGVGDGIQGITDALQNNKNAWQAISGVINGFISIAEGIEGIVTLVNTLTASTAAHTTATTTDAAATAADTAASTTNTVAKSGEAIANATASGAKMPFPANLVAIAAGVAAVVAALAMVSGAFAEGGIVGGNSISGDKLLARVNSGEMILNAAQQARLFALANGAAVNVQPGIALPQVSVQSSKLQGLLAGDNSPRQIDLRMKVRGRDLVVAAANETRSNRRRSNIKI